MERTLPNKNSRLPTRSELLNTFIPTLQRVCNTIFEAKLFTAAFILAFHAMLRIGEITLFKGNIATSTDLWHFTATSWNSAINPTFLIWTNWASEHALIHIQASNCVTCNSAALHNYVQIRTAKSGPLFILLKAIHWLVINFFTILKLSLNIMAVDSSNYNSYSFRMGAATAFALQGVDSDTIQGSGRWRSNAFHTYIR